jgi:hypothetical protein
VSTPTIQGRGNRRDLPSAPLRMPAPVRERRPALAALAIVLILGGALVSGLVALRSGNRSDYVVVRADVQAGDRIGSSDLGVARIAGTGARAIPEAQRSQVVGSYARTRLFAGILLTPDMLSARSTVPPGSAVVGLVLTAERRPAGGVQRGDIVSVYSVPRADDSGGDTGTAASQLLSAVEVVEVQTVSSGSSSGLAVSVLVPQDRAQDLAVDAALNQVAIVKLSPTTAPLVRSSDTS